MAVLCEGGGDIRIAARITELVSALLDLPSNRICVEQRKAETLQLYKEERFMRALSRNTRRPQLLHWLPHW